VTKAEPYTAGLQAAMSSFRAAMRRCLALSRQGTH
jgi:hypothetical protein